MLTTFKKIHVYLNKTIEPREKINKTRSIKCVDKKKESEKFACQCVSFALLRKKYINNLSRK